MKKDRVVPKKNYVILLFMITIIVILTFIIFDLNSKYTSSKLESSYLSGYIPEITLNEVNNVLSEPESEMFILITETNNKDVYNFENGLKKVIKKYDLVNNFIYIDYLKNNNLNKINLLFDSNIKAVPAIIYLKDGKFVKNIDSSESFLNAGEFEKLLEEYELN
ncbi:MAG: hypothetical protein IJD92_04415 [Bacilli bacterium]|nr:hypothetical protein [Bacilli bacterium]